MEAAGLAASIIAIIQVSGKLVSLTYHYISSFQKAPRDIKSLADELHTLIKILDSLKDYLDANPSSPALRKLVGKDGPIQVFAEEINALYRKFNTIDPSKLTAKLSWPLKEKDITQILSSIERHKMVFTFAMNVDQLSLLRAIEAYVIDIEHAVEYINTCVQGTASAVQEIKEDVRNTTARVQEIKLDVGGTNIAIQALQSSQDAEARTKILDWLYPESFETRHHEISGRRREGTGEWLLKSAEFCGFVRNNQSSQILWGYGIPGAGKTFLSSAVIDHFQIEARCTNNHGVAYIYFNYNEQKQQKPLQILASLVKQLASQTSQIPSDIIDLHTRLTQKTNQPTQEELYSALVSTFKSFGQVSLVFDALDECHQNHQRTTLLPLFHRMVQENPNIRIFLTSRQHPEDIQASFENSAKVELRANDEDIKLYIQQKIDGNHRARRLITSKGDYLNTIVSELTKAANGMFLLVHFHVDLICQQTTPKRIMAELERLKRDGFISKKNPLDPTYDRAIESISSRPANLELAKIIFIWLVKAQRTVTIDELRIAVSVVPGIGELEEDDLPDKETVLDVCAGLVIIDEKSGIVRLAHYTVQEYLLRVSLIPEDADANLYMATSSISFLMFDTFGRMADWPEYKFQHPFLEYAIMQLPFHLKRCDEGLTTGPILELFGDRHRVEGYSVARGFYLEGPCWRYPWPDAGLGILAQSQLQLLSMIGHLSALRIILEQKDDVMARWDNYNGSTALHYAVSGAHLEVARLLIDRGADVSAKDKSQNTPLLEALEKGHLEIARLLIDHGADVSAKSKSQRTPLFKAVSMGHLEMARLLIDRGADVSAKDKSQNTPLLEALEEGHLEIARLLIDHGADVETKNESQNTPLLEALEKGHLEIARLLIGRGADISAKNRRQRTPLFKAASMGYLEMARLLIDRGADISAKDWFQRTPLFEAASGGHLEMARLLIDRGADISAKDWFQRTPLFKAASGGHLEMARLLIDRGADVPVGWNDKTPPAFWEYPRRVSLLKSHIRDKQHNASRKRELPEEFEQLDPNKRRTLLEDRQSLQSSDILPSIGSVMDETL